MHVDWLGKTLVELVEQEAEKLVGVVRKRMHELVVGFFHCEADHVVPERTSLLTAGGGPHELEEIHIGLNHGLGILILENGNVLVLDEEYSKIYVVADGL